MDECVHLKVTIPKSVSMKFRELVNLKHPMYDRGALSYEVEMALRQYIASYTLNTHAQDTKSSMPNVEKANPNPKVYLFKKQIFKWLFLIPSVLYQLLFQLLHQICYRYNLL